MIEPTDEMIRDIRERIGGSEIAARSAAEAVLTIVERDYLPKAQLMATLAGQQRDITNTLTEAAQLLVELAKACAEESLTLKRFETEP